MKYSLLNALIYEVCLILIDHGILKKSNPIVARILAHCFSDWMEWKTEMTMKDVDRQVEEIKETWKEQENQQVIEKFQEKYPNAKVTLHDEERGAVLIEHPPDGSAAQDLLGGAMEIKSPWSNG
jgi:nitrogen fixation/metabolism regulation signal transduction histidine kinase